jgi:hypothetical protein
VSDTLIHVEAAMRWRLLIIFGLLLPADSAAPAPGESWTIAGDNVNLRRGPGVGHEIKRQLNRGRRVIERGREGEWRHVELPGADGLLGWVHESLLEGGYPEPAAASATSPDPSPRRLDPSPRAPVALRQAFQEKTPAKQPAPVKSFEDEEAILEQMRGYVNRREKLPKDPSEPRVRHSGREILSPVPIRKPGDQSRVPTELVLASSPDAAGIDLEAMETFRDSVSYLNSRAWSVAGIKLFSEIEPVGGGVVQVKTTEDWYEVPKVGQTSYLNTLVDRWASAKADGGPAGVMLVDPKGDLLMHQTKP